MFIILLCYRFQTRDELMKLAQERKQKFRSKGQEESHPLLTPRTEANHWSNSSGYYGKDNIPLLVAGGCSHKDRDNSDQAKMEQHIQYSRLDQAMTPRSEGFRDKFNPVEVPLLDTLAMEAKGDWGWSYPAQQSLLALQANRGLATTMLDRCVIREIILNGDQSEEEQKEIVSWYHDQMARDQKEMPGSPLSLDVEQVTCTLRDVLYLGGQLPHEGCEVELSSTPRVEHYGGQRDRHVQLPCRVMAGNGVTWTLMITILTKPMKKGKKVSHRVKKFKVPKYILDLLEAFPIVTGFGIKGDVLAIEDTLGLLAGRPVKLFGFVELGSLMLFAGWGGRTVNMPSCHAVTCRSVLNKTVSCAD